MTISIQESDWKYLRKRKVDMLATLCGRINEQSKDILNPSFRFFSKKVQNTDDFKDFKNLIIIISVT